MKRIILTIALITMLLLITGCNKELTENSENTVQEIGDNIPLPPEPSAPPAITETEPAVASDLDAE